MKFEALGGHCEEYYIWGVLGFDFLHYVRNNIMYAPSDLKGILYPGRNNIMSPPSDLKGILYPGRYNRMSPQSDLKGILYPGRNNRMSPPSDLKGILYPGRNNRILQKGKFLKTQLQILQNRVLLSKTVLCRPAGLPEI